MRSGSWIGLGVRSGGLAIATVLAVAQPAQGAAQEATRLIAPERTIDWSQSGVPGGIPNRTAVCASLPAGASRAKIQAALDACPADHVVRLAAGTYRLDGSLTIPSRVVLRGAGPKQTILDAAAGSGPGFIRFGPGSLPDVGQSRPITGGAAAGSTKIVVDDARGIAPGSHLMLTQLNDPAYVTISTSNGTCTWCDGGIGWKGTRVQGQIVEVTAVSGKAISVAPALYVAYARSPLATPIAMGARWAGVEDLQVLMNNTGYVGNFYLGGAAYCWLRNVESNYTDGDHVQLHWAYRNEIRDSYFHNAFAHTPGQTDADLFIADKTTATLVENNVMRRLHQAVMLNWGAAGNVIAYNYIDHNFDSNGYNTLFGGLVNHGAHPMFNLWEGNITPKLEADYFWGSSSHSTAFRNWFQGVTKIHPPLKGGRAPEQPAHGYWASQALAAIDLSQTARYYNLLGNVLGSDRQKSLGWTPQVVAPQPRSYYTTNNAYGYSFGYGSLVDEGGDHGNSSLAYSTALIHGDYDYVRGVFRWDPKFATRKLPASLYRSAKPAWFGPLPWPAFGPAPDDPARPLVGTIPAKACFEQGRMPNCLAGASRGPAPPTNLKVVH